MMSPPAVSVVIPSLNQAEYLEESLESLLHQNYPNLEIIVIDGGSSDGTMKVLKTWDKYLSYWQSAPDLGQADAIGRGFARANGELLTWLNCDDFLLPGALRSAAAGYSGGAHIMYGHYITVDEAGRVIECKRVPSKCVHLLGKRGFWAFNSIGTFFSRAAYLEVGGIRRDLEYVMDLDLYLRLIASGFRSVHVDRYMAAFRRHPRAKTVVHALQSKAEHAMLRSDYWTPFLDRLGVWRLCRLIYWICQMLSGNALMYVDTWRYSGRHWSETVGA